MPYHYEACYIIEIPHHAIHVCLVVYTILRNTITFNLIHCSEIVQKIDSFNIALKPIYIFCVYQYNVAFDNIKFLKNKVNKTHFAFTRCYIMVKCVSGKEQRAEDKFN